MFVTKKHLPRRTFLRGMGVSLALPLLDSMIPARTLLAQTAARPVTRLGFVYFPHGAIMRSWRRNATLLPPPRRSALARSALDSRRHRSL